MLIKEDSYVRIKDLRELDHNVAPYITKELYQFTGNVFRVNAIGAVPDSDQAYYVLDNNIYYWNKDWLELVPPVFKYQNLLRLDRKWEG